ncbi:MAG: hypothetical protein SGI77_01360 [Pirellulaceae bacterium]|nr:hypothetical protein [Pirellulaceae bacterium]
MIPIALTIAGSGLGSGSGPVNMHAIAGPPSQRHGSTGLLDMPKTRLNV